ncbi:unnamed protein product [Sphagnum balticum]
MRLEIVAQRKLKGGVLLNTFAITLKAIVTDVPRPTKPTRKAIENGVLRLIKSIRRVFGSVTAKYDKANPEGH